MLQASIFFGIYLGARAWSQRDMLLGAAPEIVSRDIAGETVSLEDYRGDSVLLYFWADWCPICKAQQGAINSVAKSWPVLTVAMQSGGKTKVQDYMTERKLQWRTIVDEAGILAGKYGVPGVPAMFIIDADGNVRSREMGYTTRFGLKFRLWLSTL